MKNNQMRVEIGEVNRKIQGRILPPLILWMLGVPGIIVVVLWVVLFRD